MNPESPLDAQQIVTAYTEFLERQYTRGEPSPASTSTLPYPKPTIRAAIRTVTVSLASGGQLTSDLRPWLETAYSALADYADDELVALLTEYRQAMAALSQADGYGRERIGTDAWRRLSETGPLVAEIARSLADEAEILRLEFQQFAGGVSGQA